MSQAGHEAGLAGYELINQHGQAGHEAGLAGYELVNQHDQAGHKAGLAGYGLVNQHGQADHKAGLAGYELVNQLVLVACLSWQLFKQLPPFSNHSFSDQSSYVMTNLLKW